MSWGSAGAGGWAGHDGEFMFRHPRCWGSDLGWGSQEDQTLMSWRLRGDSRLKREKRAALHSGQFPLPKLLFFSLGARTSLPPTTTGTVIHPWSGENTQILGTCSVYSLTAQERKQSEEPLAVGEEPGRYVGELPYPGSWGQNVLMPGVQMGLVPMMQNLRFSHLPLSVAPHQ